MSDVSYINWSAMSDNSIARKIGEFVKYHRMRQSKTQEILAKDAGISRSTLSLLERGESVTVATLIQVLRVLDQLQLFDSFLVIEQPSPLVLAEAEQKRRQRVSPTRKRDDINEDFEW